MIAAAVRLAGSTRSLRPPLWRLAAMRDTLRFHDMRIDPLAPDAAMLVGAITSNVPITPPMA